MVGCRYWAKCQVWPLVGWAFPRMAAEITPTRYTLSGGAAGAGSAISTGAAADRRNERRVGSGMAGLWDRTAAYQRGPPESSQRPGIVRRRRRAAGKLRVSHPRIREPPMLRPACLL